MTPMTMTINSTVPLIEKAIKDFAVAVEALAFKGSRPPDEHEYIEAYYAWAKLNLRLKTGCAEPTKRNVASLHNLAELINKWSDQTLEERDVRQNQD